MHRQILEQFIERVGCLYSWYSAHRNHFALRLLRGMITVGILTASGWFLWQQLFTGYASVSTADVSLNPNRLIVSWLCIAVATALGAWEWVLLVNALGGHLDIVRGMRIHLISNLVKYMPGFIWSYVGKVYLATQQGVPASIATLSVVCEFAIVLFDGVLLLLLSLPYSGIVSWSASQRLALQLGAILLTGTSISSIPLAGRWLVGKLKRANLTQIPLEQVNWRQVVLAVTAILLTWCLFGVGFSVLDTPAPLPIWQSILRRTVTLSSALLTGQVAFLIPMGIGVREAVFVALLGPTRSAVFVMIIALILRLELMIAEILCALVALLLDKMCAISPNNPNGLLR